MFEQVLLDRAKQRRSAWSWMGVLVQAAVVGALILVPMIHPEVLAVIAPSPVDYIPLAPVAPVPVQPNRQSAKPLQAEGPYAAVARAAAPPFVAPRSWSNPVQTIVDGPEMSLFEPLGRSTVHGASSPVAVGGISIPTAPAPRIAPEPKVEPPKPVRIGGIVLAANLIHRVTPVYPPLAKQARISGMVKLEGIIAKDGTIQRLRVISGHPLLTSAALDAVRQWRYKPTYLNDEPVEVIAPIDVNFVLSH